MSEHDEQAAFFEWCDTYSGKYPVLEFFFAVPNGGARHVVVAKKLKAEGVKPGVPDVFNLTRIGTPSVSGLGLVLEFKSSKGRLSAAQRAWATHLKDQGYRVEVPRSWIEAAKITIDYFGLPQSLKADL